MTVMHLDLREEVTTMEEYRTPVCELRCELCDPEVRAAYEATCDEQAAEEAALR